MLLTGTPLLRAADIQFAKSVIDDRFRSEGVHIGDINHDGKNDIVVGDVWYAAPDWTAHEIRKPTRNIKNRGGYSEAFGVYTDDFNKDGWIDVMVIPFHGKDAKWYENPKNEPGLWVERVAFKTTGNETRSYVDLFGTGKDHFYWSFRPTDRIQAFAVDVDGHVGNLQAPDDAYGRSEGDLQAALLINLYRDEPILHLPFRFLSLLVDIDEQFTHWRYRHALMVQRMIGTKIGTGGSSGHGYLRKAAEKNKVFTDLVNLSTFLIPRSALPALPQS